MKMGALIGFLLMAFSIILDFACFVFFHKTADAMDVTVW